MSEVSSTPSRAKYFGDVLSASVLFVIAAPVGLGIATVLGVPLQSGLIAAVIGGVVVGALSGSKTSVTGPSAGLSVILGYELKILESFETFMLALFLAGLIQIVLGRYSFGNLSYFFPSSVVRGLIAALGIILMLKQIPHLLGHDTDPIGEMTFWQIDRENTFTELLRIPADYFWSSTLIAVTCLVLMYGHDLVKHRLPSLARIPAPILAIVVGTGLGVLFRQINPEWSGDSRHFLQVPTWDLSQRWAGIFMIPEWTQLLNPYVYVAAVVIAVLTSLESLLSLDAVDRLDPDQASSPPNRELIAQGVGNSLCGLLGGLPISARVQFGYLNILSGAQSKWATIWHGVFLALSLALFPALMNLIPIAGVAAVLFYIGSKLTTPFLFKEVWQEGKYQFLPFLATIVAILFTEKLLGALLGLSVGLLFVLYNNVRRPLRKIVERHLTGELIHIEFPNQTSFLYRASLEQTLRATSPGSHILLDASDADYIDPDVLRLVKDFRDKIGPKQGVTVSVRGFQDRYKLQDESLFIDYSTRELQEQLTPADVVRLLQEGNHRFIAGESFYRDYAAQLQTAGTGQFPFAAVLSCIDSRAPVETILDLGLGDVFSVRIAGNVVGPKVVGSLEYACGVAGSKLILVLGHTKCGAVTAAAKFVAAGTDPEQATGCKHLAAIVDRVSKSLVVDETRSSLELSPEAFANYVENVTKRNVAMSIQLILSESPMLKQLADEGKIGVLGGVYNVETGQVDFLWDSAVGLPAVEPFQAAGTQPYCEFRKLVGD